MSQAVHPTRASVIRNWRRLVIAALAVSALTRPVTARASDPVMDWNEIAQQLIVVPAFSPFQQTRAMAIVHGAMPDAVNAIPGTYEPSRATSMPPAGASPEAAAIAAAYWALRG